MYRDDGLNKTEEKNTTNMYRFYEAWLISYPAITLISRPDHLSSFENWVVFNSSF